jgi:RsiW-degrading membrane proteinase PrsW (M82 family)
MIYAENILICITIPLIFSLPFVRGSARRMIASVLTGMVVCLLGAYISGFLSSVSGMSPEDTAIFISPIVEEVMKLLPLLFVLFMFETEDRHIVVTAVGIGSGFATFENCCYILTTGAERLGYIMVRGFAVGVMHIVSMIAVTIGLVLARRYKAMSFAGLLGALSISTCFHALYNLLVSEPGVSSVIGYILPPLTAILLYLPYKRLGEGTKI